MNVGLSSKRRSTLSIRPHRIFHSNSLSATSLHNCATVSHFDTVPANKALPREHHQTILCEQHPSGAVGGLVDSSERSHSVNDLIPHGKETRHKMQTII